MRWASEQEPLRFTTSETGAFEPGERADPTTGAEPDVARVVNRAADGVQSGVQTERNSENSEH